MLYHYLFLTKILLPSILALLIGFFITPILTHYFYRYRLWKRKPITESKRELNGEVWEMSKEFKKIYNKKEVSTPRVGGIIIWLTIVITTLFISLLGLIMGKESNSFSRYFFHVITRNQTFIPFASLLLGAFVGLIDDLLQIFAKSDHFLNGGIPRRVRIFIVAFLGAVEGIWFYEKLGFHQLTLPLLNIHIELGWFFILFYIIVMLGLFSSAVIDGIDGLAGGVFAIIFAAYGVIGIIQNQWSIAGFSFLVASSLFVFLWFNVPPARFYLGETGILALVLSLSSLIFLTHTVFEFLIIGLPLILTSLSVIIQIIARRFFHRKVFHVAPLHHHFEYLGWSRERITMRYWMFTVFTSLIGILIVVMKNIPLTHTL